MNTLDQVLETALQLPYEQQEILIKNLQNRLHEQNIDLEPIDLEPTEESEIYEPVDRTTVTLRIFGDDLNHTEVSRLLGCQPSKAHAKGEARFIEGDALLIAKTFGLERIARTGSWQLKSDEDRDVDLAAQIEKLLSRVNGDLDVWKKLTEKYEVDLFCGLFLEDIARELWLSAEVLQMLAARRLSIGFDIYF